MIVGIGDRHATVREHRDAERMLQPHGVALSVHVAELEQIAAGQRSHRVHRRQLDRADDVRLGIGHEHRVSASTASPEGCANAASSIGPSIRASWPDPA